MDKMRLYLDEDVHKKVATTLQPTLTETINRLSVLLLRDNPEMLVNQLMWL